MRSAARGRGSFRTAESGRLPKAHQIFPAEEVGDALEEMNNAALKRHRRRERKNDEAVHQ
jgi:hypothetical protein